MPVMPIKVRSCSSASGERSSGSSGYSRYAAASTRRALSAMALFPASSSSRSASVIRTTFPFTSAKLHRPSTTSGAPFVYWIKLPFFSWMVDIIFRTESKGASAARGSSSFKASFDSPNFAA